MRVKHILIALAGLVVIVVGGAVVAVKSIDFNQYRSMIADQAKQATGRDLKIGGDLDVGISLTPTVSVNDVSFTNASWGSRPEMVTVKRFEGQLDLLPLISGDIRVKRIVLKGADILLETDAKGHGNWVFAPANASAQAESAPAEGGGGKLPTVNNVAFEDVTITYKDGVANRMQTVALQKLNAESAGGGAPIALEIVAHLNEQPISIAGTIGSLRAILANQPMPIDIKAEAGGAAVAAKGSIAEPAAGKGVAIALTAEGKSLADLTPLAGAELPPLGPYSFSGNLSDADGGYKVADMKLKMGGSDIAGEAAIALAGDRPKISATLASTLLDAKDFGIKPAPAADAAPAASSSSDGRVFPDDPLPFDALKAVDAKVAFTGQKVIREPATLDGLVVDLDLAGGKLTIAKIDAGIAGGKLGMSGIIDGSTAQPAVALKVGGRRVEVGMLLQTFGQTAVFTGGKIDMNVDVKGQGKSVRQIMAGLGGSTDLQMGPGQINNRFAKIILSDLFQLIATGGNADGSNINCVVSKFDIAKGVATSKALAVDTGGATIVGSGKIMLDSEKLDMRLDPSAKQANLANLAIPMIVAGTLASPSVTPDPVALAKGATGAVVGMVTDAGAVGAVTGLVTGNTGSESAPADSGGCGAAAAKPAAATAEPAPKLPVPELPAKAGADKAKERVGEALKSLLPN